MVPAIEGRAAWACAPSWTLLLLEIRDPFASAVRRSVPDDLGVEGSRLFVGCGESWGRHEETPVVWF